MREVAVEQLESGMLVDEDVKDRSGRLLICADTAITDKHIRVLKTWGITSVKIVSHDPADADAHDSQHQRQVLEHFNNIDSPLFQQANAEIEHRFRHNEEFSPVIEEIKRICLYRVLSSLVEKELNSDA